VKNKITLGKVDHSSGDLGCREGELFSIEVNIEGVIGPGFTINSEEDVIIEGSEGGILISEKDIEAGNLHAGTKASAKGNLTCGNVFRSFVEAGETMTIKGDVIDSTLEASELFFLKKKGGRENSLSRLRGKIELKAKFKKVLFSNENSVSLGENLFSRKDEISEEITKKEKERGEDLKRKTEMEIRLKETVSSIGKKFEQNDKRKEEFARIGLSEKFRKLDEFENNFNAKDIRKAKEVFTEMMVIINEAKNKEEEVEGLRKESESISEKLSQISLRIFDSKLKDTGRLTITVNDRKIIVEAKEDNRDAQLDLKITYNLRDDLIWVIRNIWFYPNSFATRKRKNFLSRTPLTNVLKPFNFALNDSAEAFVLRLLK